MRINPEDAPPWAKRALLSLDREGVNHDWLPDQIDDVLGCGHYGCVYEVPDENVVLKLTTDPTEVSFIEKAIDFNEWPDGIVEYYEIRQVDMKFRKRNVYAIWREAATEVGLKRVYGRPKDWEERDLLNFQNRLDQFKDHAGRARDSIERKIKSGQRDEYLERAEKLKDWAWDYIALEDAEGKRSYGERRKYTRIENLRGVQRTAASLRACDMLAEMMYHEHMVSQVGYALSFYLEKGILLADVHSDNVGVVEREDWTIWVITDPGHALDIRIDE